MNMLKIITYLLMTLLVLGCQKNPHRIPTILNIELGSKYADVEKLVVQKLKEGKLLMNEKNIPYFTFDKLDNGIPAYGKLNYEFNVDKVLTGVFLNISFSPDNFDTNQNLEYVVGGSSSGEKFNDLIAFYEVKYGPFKKEYSHINYNDQVTDYIKEIGNYIIVIRITHLNAVRKTFEGFSCTITYVYSKDYLKKMKLDNYSSSNDDI